MFLIKRSIPILLICCSFLFFTGKGAWAKAGIITSLDATIQIIKTRMTISNHSTLAGREFYEGKLGDSEVVLVQSPMGKVNNAITAQLLISKFAAKALLSISPAGGVGPDITIGDIVLGSEVYQHDFGTWKPYGFIWNRVPVYNKSMSTDYNRFPGRALSALAMMNPSGEAIGRNKVVPGIIVSGDQFIASPEKRVWLQKKFHAAAVDMGAAAIAQVGYANSVPVCLVRIITDSAGLDARTLFADSTAAYQTDIDLAGLVTGIAESIIQ